MEACEAAGVAVWVLDRPDPMGGHITGGPMLDQDLQSFIGIHPVPQVYGMTPGEWARMIRAERTPDLDLRVIAMDGWRRGMNFGELGWVWIPTSQHIPHWETSYFYAMTGTLGELHKLNNGVGTPSPFELVGTQWLDPQAFAAGLNAYQLPGVIFRATSFKPRYAFGSGELLHGVQIHISDFATVDATQVAQALAVELIRTAPERQLFDAMETASGKVSMYLKAHGDRGLAKLLAENDLNAYSKTDKSALESFRERRSEYLIYR